MRISQYLCLRPLYLRGQIYGPGERIRASESEALPLVATGHLVEIVVKLADDRWTQLTLR